jgi:hypothetical protein
VEGAAKLGKKLRAPVECHADRVEARDIASHRTQDAMPLFECFPDLRILGSFSQESLYCPGYTKTAIVQIPVGKIERKVLIGAVGPIIQYPLSQAPYNCHASRAFRNSPALVRVGRPETKTVPALIDPLSNCAALLPTEGTKLRQHTGFAEQVAQIIAPLFEQVFADIRKEVKMAGQDCNRYPAISLARRSHPSRRRPDRA